MWAGNQLPVYSVYHKADEMTGKIYKLEVESPKTEPFWTPIWSLQIRRKAVISCLWIKEEN